MTPIVWAGLAFAIGIVVMIADYRMATNPDPADRYKKRKKLNPVAAKQLRDMFLWTCGVAVAAYYVPDWF